ncbi:MAG: hypothetical protein ACTXOO_02415 [Sodalis sp. (in: enterobacteria)]
MMIRLYSQATITPKIRAALQASNELAYTLAKRYGISELTFPKWGKDGVENHAYVFLSFADDAIAC